MSKLNIDQKTIKELFLDSKADFLIPDYQRPYAWRNEEAHSAPEIKNEEIDAALHIVVSHYVFAAMISITELEMGKNNDF